jgi:hypothetical protein
LATLILGDLFRQPASAARLLQTPIDIVDQSKQINSLAGQAPEAHLRCTSGSDLRTFRKKVQ